MERKLTILTILVGCLAFLSFYGVYGRSDSDYTLAAAQIISDQIGNDSLKNRIGSEQGSGGYVLPVSPPNYWPIRNLNYSDPILSARSFLLFDTKNNKILYEYQAQKTLPIASLTKILTAIIVQENLDPKMVVKIESDMYRVDGESADFNLGESVFVKDLLGVMLVKSSNDAAKALARTVEQRTKRSFADLMNQQARMVGVTNSNFLDPAGLKDEAFSTAEDLLKLIRYSKKYPEIWYWMRQPSLQITSVDGSLQHSYVGTNRLLDAWPTVVGGKTGYTEGALGCMILEVDAPALDSSLVAIVLGSSSRFEETKALIEWGAQAFRWE